MSLCAYVPLPYLPALEKIPIASVASTHFLGVITKLLEPASFLNPSKSRGLKAGLLKEVHTTGITGSTGAGQSLSASSHFSWRSNNIQAYKTLTHQHLGEIHQSLHHLQNSFPSTPLGDTNGIHFVPWRGDFTRGIFISSQLHCEKKLDELYALYESYYEGHPFTHVTHEPVFLKQVINTNKCIIQLEKAGNQLVVHSVADNLLKGASGQAVQNMNLLFGLGEEEGLRLKASAF